ncbi:RteC protein [Chryseobacterium sp. 52]|uniref:RteC domain-containing protein n=1 Tax=Chryseobacterium sp. 52 TaxID=2035213 RepID=UPI000C192882|nr:RteC domain-containing protein [Chryseobacterium sp. 52]PIF45289.1 RteC protein [Chryseobacterium sp. 52]
MKNFCKNVQLKIREEEHRISLDSPNAIDESRSMAMLLNDLLGQLKEQVMLKGFENEHEEIDFFKKIKPNVMGKLLFYNKVFRIETSRPVSMGSMYQAFYSNELVKLEQKYNDHISGSEFYRYYRSGSNKQDAEFFLRGKIDLNKGLKSHAFESDPHFSTYYDYKVSRIIENDLLYEYLLSRIDHGLVNIGTINLESGYDTIRWTESKNALIELIYGLYASECITNGRVGIRKISSVFQALFNIQLGDVHHAFHRMKDRPGNRSIFLERMKQSLEQYMDKDLYT